MSFVVIIPARYASTRLAEKPLANINGKPMVIHVLERAYESGANRVIVAIDHKKVGYVVKKAGGETCMTCTKHQSGIERLSEVIEKYDFDDNSIIVNIQCDEPAIPAIMIRKVAENLSNYRDKVCVSTLAAPINNIEQVFDPNVVKVVLDEEGCALYFSRATIPWNRDKLITSKKVEVITNSVFLQHIGIYSYCAKFIRYYVNCKPSPIEKIEMLEQLRTLWYGKKIHVAITKKIPVSGVDTPEDLERARVALR